MNDITKARAFLNAQDSDLQHLTSFGLMLATAKQRYNDICLKKQGSVGDDNLDRKEVGAALELSVLRYLRKHNHLPPNVTNAFRNGITVEEQQELALSWMNA